MSREGGKSTTHEMAVFRQPQSLTQSLILMGREMPKIAQSVSITIMIINTAVDKSSRTFLASALWGEMKRNEIRCCPIEIVISAPRDG